MVDEWVNRWVEERVDGGWMGVQVSRGTGGWWMNGKRDG